MRRIKQAIDPLGVLNPGKIFPESIESVGVSNGRVTESIGCSAVSN